jgi:hypothetical protein
MAACSIVMSSSGSILGISTICDGFVARPAHTWDDTKVIATALYLQRTVSAEVGEEFLEACCTASVQLALREFGCYLKQ